MRKTLLLLLCVTSVLLLNAQTPVNDEYAGAIEVIPSTDALCRSTASGTTIGATESMPGCFGSAEDDIWFKFTATSNRHRIITYGDNINHVLQLFSLSSGNLTSIACRYLTNPTSYGSLSAEFNTLIPGTTYYYRVYGAGSSSQRGQITNCIISPPPPPANDECSGAIELPVNADENCTNVYSGQFGYASQSFPAFIDKGYDAFDIWFKFTATTSSHRIRLTYDDNTTTPLMQAFSGNCNNLVSIGYFTPTVQYQTQPVVGMLTSLIPGNTYYIRIYNDFSVSRPNETIGLCISSPLGALGYQYPIVSLTSPANGSVFTAPTSINLSASVVEGEEPVQKVEFFYREGLHSEIKLGEDLTAPYEFAWNDVFPGEYRVTAKATDLVGATAISAADITVNTPPTNQLPTIDFYAYPIGSGIAPGAISINVMAQDPDGTIAKIELYENGTLLYETQDPFINLTMVDLSSGGYTYQAKAIDNQGGATYSQLMPLFIYDPLTVNLTSPANGLNFTAPATITLEATPSGGDGTFSKVEFYNGTTKLGEDLTAPYTFDWTNVAAGTYTLTAKVFHSMGDNAASGTVTITVNEPLNQLPSISLTAPTNGATFTAPATISLTASASDPDGSITKVEFYNGASKIGEDITAPYQYEWAGVSAGTYSLTAKAIDNRGGISSSTAVSITVLEPNLPPTVTLSTPLVTYGPTNSDPVTIFTEATAYDPDGSIAKVEFYQNGMPIGVATTPPYHFVAVITTSGLYTFTARAYDNLGVSSEMSVDVWVQRVPRVVLNSPANGATFIAPATVNLSATVDQGDGAITKVEFYNGTTKLGEDLTSPYSLDWNNVEVGTYTVTAKVSDDLGQSTFSPEVIFTVNEPVNQLPTVSLTAPVNGTSFTAPASISLTATASDADGTISKVEFYNGTTKIGEDLTAPYAYSWNGVAEGSYSLSAKAIDNLGAVSSSASVSVTVSAPLPVTLVAKNSVWKYNDKGVDLGTSWTAINYNDASWSSGAGLLGYGLPVTTTLNYGNVNSKYPSYYFRRSFTVTDASIYATLVFNIRRDDGAVVYLNGAEQFRTNMPGGKINYKTFASSDLDGSNQTNYFSFSIPASQLRNGTNVIAVSVHQSNRKSADMCFDMEITGELKTTNKLQGARINTNKVSEANDKNRVLVKALPNPSPSYFTVILQSDKSETIDIRVIDVMGRVIETRRKLPASGVIKLGHNYPPGIYFAEVIQGIQRTTLKLVKGVD